MTNFLGVVLFSPVANNKNTNGRSKTQPSTDTLHLRLSPKTINLIRKQAKILGRTMHTHACILLQRATGVEAWTTGPTALGFSEGGKGKLVVD